MHLPAARWRALGCACLAALAAARPVDLIIDTDMSIDVDDVGALCVAHALADLGEANLLAVIHDTGLAEGIGGVSVINEYYGRRPPLGAYRGVIGRPGPDLAKPEWTNQGQGQYVHQLLSEYASTVRKASDVPSSLTTYRTTLSQAEDGSVTIVAVGFATAILELLLSPPDAICAQRNPSFESCVALGQSSSIYHEAARMWHCVACVDDSGRHFLLSQRSIMELNEHEHAALVLGVPPSRTPLACAQQLCMVSTWWRAR